MTGNIEIVATTKLVMLDVPVLETDNILPIIGDTIIIQDFLMMQETIITDGIIMIEDIQAGTNASLSK